MLFGQRKGPYRFNKSCSLAQLDELAAAVNKEALLLDDEKRGSALMYRSEEGFAGKLV